MHDLHGTILVISCPQYRITRVLSEPHCKHPSDLYQLGRRVLVCPVNTERELPILNVRRATKVKNVASLESHHCFYRSAAALMTR